MKKYLTVLLALIFVLDGTLSVRAGAAVPTGIESETAVLIDRVTGQVLYNKNMNLKMYPASTTKILTALLTVEACRPYEIVTVSESAVNIMEPGSSNIALVPGEQLSVEQALYALMLPSANDVANVLAEHVAGSQEAFAKLMTAKAKEIGARNSNFTNPHGLHDDNHYTTAYDMALITRYAMQNEDFRTYFGAARYTITPTNKNTERPLTNYQHMLVKETDWYNPDVTGGKIGYTHEAMHTMSTSATRAGRDLICVVMYSTHRDAKFADTEALLNFGFEEFSPVSVSKEWFSGMLFPVQDQGRIVGSAEFDAKSDFTALVHNGTDPDGLRIRFERPDVYLADQPINCDVYFELESGSGFIPSVLGRVSLIPTVSLAESMTIPLPESESGGFFKWLGSIFRVIGVIFASVLFAAVVMLAIRRYRIVKMRKLRKARVSRLRAIQDSTVGYSGLPSNPPPIRTSQHRSASRNRRDFG